MMKQNLHQLTTKQTTAAFARASQFHIYTSSAKRSNIGMFHLLFKIGCQFLERRDRFTEIPYPLRLSFYGKLLWSTFSTVRTVRAVRGKCSTYSAYNTCFTLTVRTERALHCVTLLGFMILWWFVQMWSVEKELLQL